MRSSCATSKYRSPTILDRKKAFVEVALNLKAIQQSPCQEFV